jgi:hypothetical protein
MMEVMEVMEVMGGDASADARRGYASFRSGHLHHNQWPIESRLGGDTISVAGRVRRCL